MRQLLVAGAKVDQVQRDCWTPLISASSLGFDAVVSVLISAGADVTILNGKAKAAAIEGGHTNIERMLLLAMPGVSASVREANKQHQDAKSELVLLVSKQEAETREFAAFSSVQRPVRELLSVEFDAILRRSVDIFWPLRSYTHGMTSACKFLDPDVIVSATSEFDSTPIA